MGVKLYQVLKHINHTLKLGDRNKLSDAVSIVVAGRKISARESSKGKLGSVSAATHWNAGHLYADLLVCSASILD